MPHFSYSMRYKYNSRNKNPRWYNKWPCIFFSWQIHPRTFYERTNYMSRTTNFQACAILCKMERFMAGYIMLSVNPTLKCLTIICLSWCQRLFIWTFYYIRIEKVSTKEMISITIFYNSYHPKYKLRVV